mmetsp:Transcript_17617/g.38435  ORF Transcript_17617/g.38435 Transcript_17617/m.38435 type:complete len:375 (+) Transcript_17617:224-1348(+)
MEQEYELGEVHDPHLKDGCHSPNVLQFLPLSCCQRHPLPAACRRGRGSSCCLLEQIQHFLLGVQLMRQPGAHVARRPHHLHSQRGHGFGDVHAPHVERALRVVIRRLRHLLEGDEVRLEEPVENLARVLHGEHRHLRDLLLLQLALDGEEAEDAAGGGAEAVAHGALHLLEAHEVHDALEVGAGVHRAVRALADARHQLGGVAHEQPQHRAHVLRRDRRLPLLRQRRHRRADLGVGDGHRSLLRGVQLVLAAHPQDGVQHRPRRRLHLLVDELDAEHVAEAAVELVGVDPPQHVALHVQALEGLPGVLPAPPLPQHHRHRLEIGRETEALLHGARLLRQLLCRLRLCSGGSSAARPGGSGAALASAGSMCLHGS